MRPIKFRGKRVDNGEWVYGLLFNYSYRGEIKTFIQRGEYAFKNGSYYGNEVDPETVGQFTGLTDKNGVDIYEGDVLSWKNYKGETFNNTVYFCVGTAYCGWKIKNGRYHKPLSLNGIINAEASVISNTHSKEGQDV